MIDIVAFVGFFTLVISTLSCRYQQARDELQPKWWYGVVAVCIVCHFIFAFLIYEEYPILAIMLFVSACALSYVICRMAISQDRIQKR